MKHSYSPNKLEAKIILCLYSAGYFKNIEFSNVALNELKNIICGYNCCRESFHIVNYGGNRYLYLTRSYIDSSYSFYDFIKFLKQQS